MLRFFLKRMKGNATDRTMIGKLAGYLGLLSNALLFVAKFLIGLSAQSVSIMADAINSLSDTASSFLTLIGFRIAAKPADREHPYGHERFEYISGFVVSLLITFVGFQFLKNAFEKIIAPEPIRLSPWLFIVLILSIGLKLWQGLMYRQLAKKIDSATLQASGQDSFNDVLTTVAVLLSALIEWGTGWRVDGYIGLLIALYILFSGIMMIRTFINELLGARPTEAEIREMEDRLDRYPTILGYHDLLVHNYGPKNRFASVHIEVNESWSLSQAHEVIDAIEHDFQRNLQVELVCHLDPVPIQNKQYRQLREKVRQIVETIDPELRMHDFRIHEKQFAFDLVIPKQRNYKDRELQDKIYQKITHEIGTYEVAITFDHTYLL